MRMITNLPQKKSDNCYSSGICYLLERRGKYLSEPISFGLSAGLNFAVKIDEGISFSAVRELHCLTNFIFKLGVLGSEHPETSFASFLHKAHENIDCDMPLMSEYDGFYFPFTPIFKKKHEKHIALIVGYDRDILYVSDFLYGAYEVPISCKLFEQAVDLSNGSCVGPKWYDVSVPEDINEKITPSLIIKSIQHVCEYFLSHNISNDEMMIGIEGMYKFSEKIPDLMRQSVIKIDWVGFSDDTRKAVTTFRHYGNFIAELATLKLIDITMDDAQEIQALFYDVSNSWQIITNLIFKYSLTSKDTIPLKISKQISKSALILEEAFSKINAKILNR